MSLNQTILTGRVAIKDIEVTGEDTKAYGRFKLSVKRDFKAEGEQYAKEDLIDCKVWGKTAINMAKFFKKNDYVTVMGRLQRDDNYINKETQETVYGQMYVSVTGFYFPEGAKSSGETGSTPSTTPASAPKTPGKPPVKAPTPGAAPKRPPFNFNK